MAKWRWALGDIAVDLDRVAAMGSLGQQDSALLVKAILVLAERQEAIAVQLERLVQVQKMQVHLAISEAEPSLWLTNLKDELEEI